MTNIILKLAGSIMVGAGTYIGYELAKVLLEKAKHVDYKALADKLKIGNLKDKVGAN